MEQKNLATFRNQPMAEAKADISFLSKKSTGGKQPLYKERRSVETLGLESKYLEYFVELLEDPSRPNCKKPKEKQESSSEPI